MAYIAESYIRSRVYVDGKVRFGDWGTGSFIEKNCHWPFLHWNCDVTSDFLPHIFKSHHAFAGEFLSRNVGLYNADGKVSVGRIGKGVQQMGE
jgi:hypothetical protein